MEPILFRVALLTSYYVIQIRVKRLSQGRNGLYYAMGGPTLSEFSIEFLSHIPNRREKALIIFSLFQL